MAAAGGGLSDLTDGSLGDSDPSFDFLLDEKEVDFFKNDIGTVRPVYIGDVWETSRCRMTLIDRVSETERMVQPTVFSAQFLLASIVTTKKLRR